MDRKSQLKTAFDFTKQAFPFENYITAATWFEVNAIISRLQQYLPEFSGKRLLDIGCGPMDKTGVLQRLGFSCCAVDDLNDPWHLENDNAEKIKQYASDIGISFHQQKPGDYSIPFEEGSFDVVSAFAVIEHLHESPRGLLNVMGTFVRPGGLIVVTMPNSANLRKRLSVLFGRTNYPPVEMFFASTGDWRGHVREYTLQETAYICGAAGFEVLSRTTFEHLAQQKLRTPLSQVYTLLGTIVPTFRSQLLVICRKPEDWEPATEDPEAYRRALAWGVPEGVA